jgi:hypothetical protein
LQNPIKLAVFFSNLSKYAKFSDSLKKLSYFRELALALLTCSASVAADQHGMGDQGVEGAASEEFNYFFCGQGRIVDRSVRYYVTYESIWFSSGKYRQGLGWNFPEASRNRSSPFPRILQPVGCRRFSCCRHLAIKQYERLRERPSPWRNSTVLEFSYENYIAPRVPEKASR